ncbi:DEAD/DEAH box helicase [Macrococcoides canis]|nr:DEAD/DEAH box helicase [Macrococcus canis]
MEGNMRQQITNNGTMPSVIKKGNKYHCNYCLNDRHYLFHSYYHEGIKKEIVYCRACLSHYATTENFITLESCRKKAEAVSLQIPFELTAQQKRASDYIVNQFHKNEDSLLYAVTGAGKTEMMLQAVAEARRLGCNVAITAPRTDVVKELALRIQEYMPKTQIDILYGGHQALTEGHLVVATVHQLIQFNQHFELIIVDEIDAFPMNYDPRLSKVLERALHEKGTIIYLSATPPARLMRLPHIYLPSRYHNRPLPLPKLHYYKIDSRSLQQKLKNIVNTTLIFFNDIKQMEKYYAALPENIKNDGTIVYSNDDERHDKVEAIRRGEYRFIFTTTILERGFTQENLSVWVINSEQFTWDSLVQIAGRVDRKGTIANGEVIFYHEGLSTHMTKAIHTIKRMNKKHDQAMSIL